MDPRKKFRDGDVVRFGVGLPECKILMSDGEPWRMVWGPPDARREALISVERFHAWGPVLLRRELQLDDDLRHTSDDRREPPARVRTLHWNSGVVWYLNTTRGAIEVGDIGEWSHDDGGIEIDLGTPWPAGQAHPAPIDPKQHGWSWTRDPVTDRLVAANPSTPKLTPTGARLGPAPATPLLETMQRAIAIADSDSEPALHLLARAIFFSDEEVRSFVRDVSDYRLVLKVDVARFEAAMQKAWERDEKGWRTRSQLQAACINRAVRMHRSFVERVDDQK